MIMLITIVATIVFTWPIIIRTILSYWRVILTLLAPTLVNVGIKRIVGYCIVTIWTRELGDYLCLR